MAVYILTGKLGGGKTLCAVHKIDEAIRERRIVATNLDIHLHRLPGVRDDARGPRVVRLPDRPTSADLADLGYGVPGVRNETEAKVAYDEARFGVIVLDECGTWLNAREWQDGDRRQLLDLLLHIRKKLWHVYLIIQDISMLDKQVRKAIAEHVVYCRNLANFKIPFLSGLSEAIIGKKLTLPKAHVGIVKYGDQPSSVTVDRWVYSGGALYGAYDTTQVFRSDYDLGSYSVLPPGYRRRAPRAPSTWRTAMRKTRIAFKRHSRTMLIAAGVALGAAAMSVFGGYQAKGHEEIAAQRAAQEVGKPPMARPSPFQRRFNVDNVQEYQVGGATFRRVVLVDQSGRMADWEDLKREGYQFDYLGPCRIRLTEPGGVTTTARCREIEESAKLGAPMAAAAAGGG